MAHMAPMSATRRVPTNHFGGYVVIHAKNFLQAPGWLLGKFTASVLKPSADCPTLLPALNLLASNLSKLETIK
jgi:hypothetical protein